MTQKSVDSKDMANPDGAWLRLSGAFTHLTDTLSSGDRHDITVAVAPGAGWGSPAAFLPPAAGIEIDGKFWPEDFDPRHAYPWDHRDWANYPAVMGLLAHEVAHTQHSDWAYEAKKDHFAKRKVLSEADQHALGAAELLEESRVEAAHLLERPQDTPYLQASATTIALAEALADGNLQSKKAAARVASLVLARHSGGSIEDSPEYERVKDSVVKVLGTTEKDGAEVVSIADGEKLLEQLRTIWTEFQDLPDGSTDDFLRLGKQWFDLTQDDGSPGDQGQDGQGGIPQEIKDALEALAKKAMGDASGKDALDKLLKRLADAVNSKVNEQKSQKAAKKAADDVFSKGQAPGETDNRYSFNGYREPEVKERQLAHKTARAILKAYIREKAVTTIHSDRPPGRMRPVIAVQGQAQRSMGMYPNVEPFTRKERAHTPSPPLKVGIIVDTSDSQDVAVAAATSGAWSLATAVQRIPDGTVAMSTFGNGVKAVIAPWDKPKGVPRLRATGGTDHLLRSMKAIEGALNLMRPGSARLLVIVTDGFTSGTDLAGRDPALKRYLEAGVHVLWVVTGSKDYYPDNGLNGSAGWYGHGDQKVVPEVKGVHGEKVHVVYPYTDGTLIPAMITSEAVRTLEQS